MSTKVSSATSSPSFHPTSPGNPSRRRKWSEQTDQKLSKRMKMSSWPDLQSGISSSDKVPSVPFSSSISCLSSSHKTPLNESLRFPLSTRVIDLRQKSHEQNDDDAENEMSRMVDLSTGEPLDVIPATSKQRKRTLKAKRSIEQVVDEVEESMQTVRWAFQTGQVNSAVVDDASVRPPNKKVRTLQQPTSSYIEEVGDDQENNVEPHLFPQMYGIMEDLRLQASTIPPEKISASVNGTYTSNPSKDSADSLSFMFQGRNAKKLEFTVPYKKAFADYMRTQLDYLKADGHGDDGKQLVLYQSNNAKYMHAFFKTDKSGEDSGSKIQEIIDEEGDEEMLFEEVGANKSQAIFEERQEVQDINMGMMYGGQVGINDRFQDINEVGQEAMDIDC